MTKFGNIGPMQLGLASEKMPKHAIAVIAFDRISPFHLAVPCVVFGDVHPGVPPFRLMVCAGEEGRLTTTAGFDVLVRHGLEALEIADAIIVPVSYTHLTLPTSDLV